MIRFLKGLTAVVALLLGTAAGTVAQDAAGSPRIALVIGNGAYAASPLPTAANDAGLVAQTLAAAGFDVTGARDLDAAALRRTVHDFIGKASAGGPRGIAIVYLAGRALQVDGENYYAPIDARLERPSDLSIEAFRITDLTRALAATTLGARVVVVDAAYGDAKAPGPFAAGLALSEPERGTVLAFNAAPGTLAPVEPGPYGTYATILTQNMKQGGIPVDEAFDRVRVAVDVATRGTVTPWDASKLLQPFTFFDRADNAPARGSAQVPFTSLRTRPLRDFSPEQAYDVAIARDTLASYQDYLTAFPDHPLGGRVRQIMAVRREALFWRAAVRANAAPAFWTYLRSYSKGPHGAEAQRRLARLSAGRQPPADFVSLSFDVAPPPREEIVIVERPIDLADPALPPPPPPPLFLLPPPSEEAVLQPPPPPPGPRFLPLPIAVAIPFVRPILAPGVVTPPRGVMGSYRQPRPFAAGPAKGGVVPHFVTDRPDADADPSTGPPHAPVAPVVPAVPQPVVPRPAVPEPVAPHPPVPPNEAFAPHAPRQVRPIRGAAQALPAPVPTLSSLAKAPKGKVLPAPLPKIAPSTPAEPRPIGGAAPARPRQIKPAPAAPAPAALPANPRAAFPKPNAPPPPPQLKILQPQSVRPTATPPGALPHRENHPECGHPGQPTCR